MQFYFIRHGQSENNALWNQTSSSIGRSEDAELTEVGARQARVLAQFLHDAGSGVITKDWDGQNIAGFGITHLCTSLMVRAVATSMIIADTLGLRPVAWEDLHESGGINLEDPQTGERIGQPGKNRAYFEVHYPHLVLPATLGEEGWWNRPFEEREQRPIRAQRVLRELLERHGSAEDRVAVVSHGGFYNYLLAAILKMPDHEGCWFALNNAAITRIDFHVEGVEVIYMNRLDFMPRELVT